MDLELSETQEMVRRTARAFAVERIRPRARAHDKEEIFPAALLKEMAGLGLLAVNVPADLGGAEAGSVAYALALMEVASACASTAVAMAVTNMCAETLVRFGSPEHKERFVRGLASGALVCGAFALSEAHAGSDAAALKTSARRHGKGWVLNGTKQWITSGSHAGVIVVWARTDKGISAFAVDGQCPGITRGKPEEKMGLRGSNTVSLTFEDCEIPQGALLGEEGKGLSVALMALDGGRIGIAAQACGVARSALEASAEYAKERRAFGVPIASHEAIRFMLADMRTELEAAIRLLLRAAWLKEAGRPFTKEASMAKLFASEMSGRVCERAVQVHGGYGYIDEFPVERYLRDSKVQTIYEGTSEIQRLVIAREILRTAPGT